jgi:hypothetical protein
MLPMRALSVGRCQSESVLSPVWVRQAYRSFYGTASAQGSWKTVFVFVAMGWLTAALGVGAP